ncbi:hypothetical protein DFS34DRAFT_648769 [Phlyctochytrium arcticum]|nr:hypothetical protein DFS34DRAFT_648769 [Phlyctochytrium arcticum]
MESIQYTKKRKPDSVPQKHGKKARVSFNEDPPSADEQEDLETAKARRGAVKLDGYGSESDSDSDADGKAGGDGMDEDMFGDSFDAPAKGKNKPRFLKSSEIEGQELETDFGADADGEIKITPFNMKEELQDGNFDESGHYIRKRDELSMHDKWLQNLSTEEIAKAKQAQDRHREKLNMMNADSMDSQSPAELWQKILGILESKETLPKAMRRLAGPKKGKRQQRKKTGVVVPQEQSPAEKQAEVNKEALNALTECADILMGQGSVDIYDMTKEQIEALLAKK